jgi:DNA-binding transcriptional ArsR family regulator
MNLENATKAFTALSQETRLKVFKILVEYGKTGVSAGIIGERLNIPHNTLSFHLSSLSKVDLISSKKDGRQMIYCANISAIEELIGYLKENCCVIENSGRC